MGHTPRAMNLRVYGEQTRKVMPGDLTTISGIFLPTPLTGLRAMSNGLVTETHVEVMSVHRHKKTYKEIQDDLEANDCDEVDRLGEDKKLIYDRLASSLAPEIHGHRDVKKALLLQLVGGLTRVQPDGLKIR